MISLLRKIGSTCKNIAAQKSEILFAVVTAGALLFGATLYTLPRIDLYSQGLSFAELSQNPFGVHDGNALHYRMFFPFMSWLFGLSGEGVVFSAIIFAFLFLFLLAFGLQKHGITKTGTFLITTIFAITIPTQFTLVYGGFADALIYTLLLLALFTVHKKHIFWTALTLALYTHESVALLFPFFVFYRAHQSGVTRKNIRNYVLRELIPAFAIMFIPYILYRIWVNAQMTSDVLTSGKAGTQMYCVLKSIQDPLSCIREVNLLGELLFWAIYGSYRIFLLAPIYAISANLYAKNHKRLIEYTLIFIALLLSFPLNLDTTRVVGIMLFPMILLSLKDTAHKKNSLLWITGGILLTILLPRIYAINGTMRYFLGMPDLWQRFFENHYQQVDRIFGPPMGIHLMDIAKMFIWGAIGIMALTKIIILAVPKKTENFEIPKNTLFTFLKKHQTAIFFAGITTFLIILNESLLPTSDEYFYSLITKAFEAAWNGQIAWHNILTEHVALVPFLVFLWNHFTQLSSFPLTRVPIFLFSLGFLATLYAISGTILPKEKKIWTWYILLLIPGFWIFSVRFMLDIPSVFSVSLLIYFLLKRSSLPKQMFAVLLVLCTKEYYLYATLPIVVITHLSDALFTNTKRIKNTLKAVGKIFALYLPSLIAIFTLLNFNIFPYPRLLETSLRELFGKYYQYANTETLLAYQKIDSFFKPKEVPVSSVAKNETSSAEETKDTSSTAEHIEKNIENLIIPNETPTGIIKNQNEEIAEATPFQKIWLIAKYNFSENDIHVLLLPFLIIGIMESLRAILRVRKNGYEKTRPHIILGILFLIFVYFNYHQATALHGFRITLPMVVSIAIYVAIGADTMLKKRSVLSSVVFIVGTLIGFGFYWAEVSNVHYGSVLSESGISRLLAIKPYLFLALFTCISIGIYLFPKIHKPQKWIALQLLILALFAIKFLPYGIERQVSQIREGYDYRLTNATPVLKAIRAEEKNIAGNIHPYRIQYYSDDPKIGNFDSYPSIRYWTELFGRPYDRFPINDELLQNLKSKKTGYFILVNENFQKEDIEKFRNIEKTHPEVFKKISVQREKGKIIWEIYSVDLSKEEKVAAE